jgi:hypothetical protein
MGDKHCFTSALQQKGQWFQGREDKVLRHFPKSNVAFQEEGQSLANVWS